MATVVQTATANASGSPSYAGTFASPVTAGNTVFLIASGYNTLPAAISTSSPTLGGVPVSGAVKLAEQAQTGASVALGAGAWMLPNVPGGSTAFGITVNNNTFSGSANGVIAIEVAGLGQAPVTDRIAPGAHGSGATSFSSGATQAIQFANEFILAFCGQDQGTTSAGQPGAPWTVISLDAAQNFTVAYQLVSAPGGSYSVTYTTSTTASYALGAVTVAPTMIGATANVSVAAPAGSAASSPPPGVQVSVTETLAFHARIGMTAQATMEFEAGQPVQAGLITLAADPWTAMYPG